MSNLVWELFDLGAWDSGSTRSLQCLTASNGVISLEDTQLKQSLPCLAGIVFSHKLCSHALSGFREPQTSAPSSGT